MFSASAALEVVVVVLEFEVAFPPFPSLPKEDLHASHISASTLMGFVMRTIVDCADELSSHASALSVRALHIYFWQGLANYHLRPGEARYWRAGPRAFIGSTRIYTFGGVPTQHKNDWPRQ